MNKRDAAMLNEGLKAIAGVEPEPKREPVVLVVAKPEPARPVARGPRRNPRDYSTRVSPRGAGRCNARGVPI